MKTAAIAFACLFAGCLVPVSASVPLADAAYLIVVLLFSVFTSLSSFRNYYNPMLLLLLVAGFLIGAISNFPGADSWNSEGESTMLHFLEREIRFFVFFLAAIVNSIYMFIGMQKAKQPNYNQQYSVNSTRSKPASIESKRLKFLILSSYDVGGASIAAIRLHTALLKAGVQSRLLTLHKTKNDIPEHYQFQPPGSIGERIRLKLRQRKEHKLKNSLRFPPEKNMQGKYSIPEASYEIHQSAHWKWADVVNPHWINEWLSVESLFTHSGDKPLIWTLHDEHLFTGGCHYSEACTGFQTECSNCPMLSESSLPDIASHFLKAKLLAYQQFQPRIKVVAPSQWMVNKAAKSSLLSGVEGKRIFNSLDRQIFLPVPQDVCREVLGLPREKIVLLSVTQTMEDERKGYRFLKDALNSGDLPQDWILCTVGKLDPSQEVSGIPHKHLGSIQDQRFMAIIYNAASVFIHPATEDNLPNVVAEALMCGIPVAGFQIGGMPEMVDESNGRLAEEISASSLLGVIEQALQLSDRRELISSAAASRYSPDNQAKEYIQVAESMLKPA